MKKFLANFQSDESGAITVDFVVLTAAICTLGLVVIVLISGNMTGIANEVRDFILNVPI